jgi:hypothetical protein
MTMFETTSAAAAGAARTPETHPARRGGPRGARAFVRKDELSGDTLAAALA